MISINEKTQKGLLSQGIKNPNVQQWFYDMWIEDINSLTGAPKEKIIDSANSILIYFNSPLRVVDFTWDYSNKCYVWMMEKRL